MNSGLDIIAVQRDPESYYIGDSSSNQVGTYDRNRFNSDAEFVPLGAAPVIPLRSTRKNSLLISTVGTYSPIFVVLVLDPKIATNNAMTIFYNPGGGALEIPLTANVYGFQVYATNLANDPVQTTLLFS